MSYLNALRLHFAGQFQANVSTINNDPYHFNNAAFQSAYQGRQGPGMQPPNGWFNPQGDAAFRLLGCRVTSAFMTGGVGQSDAILSALVADADGQAPAKLVDLDSEQQLVSEIWGLQVRITNAAGETLMSGAYEPASFLDIWDRATGSGGAGDTSAGSTYQSVLTDVQWGDVSGSVFLTALQAASADTGMLSIKFNVDGFDLTFTSPTFMCGRIVGSIGPYAVGEPHHLVIGRQFMTASAPPDPNVSFFKPAGGINFFPAVIDEVASCAYLDLGNALSTGIPGGSLNDLGDLTLSAVSPEATPSNPAGTTIALGVIPSRGAGGYASDPDWYTRTAGVAVLPLSAAELEASGIYSLVLSGANGAIISEWSNAAFVRMDQVVYRLSPGDQVGVAAYAMQYGRPLAGASIAFAFDPSQLQVTPDGFPYVGAGPPVATPTSALMFPATQITDASGRAVLPVTGGDPGTPRSFDGAYGIDGQVYGIRPAFADDAMNAGPINPWNFVSLLLWSGYAAPSSVTWTDLQPIFQQYANLYPVMLRFLDLADYGSVKANAPLLSLAFGLDPRDPNAMPVTRDLSPAKRQAILTWLQNPVRGVAPATPAAAKTAAQPETAPPGAAQPVAARGGKAAAAARRLVLQAR